MITARIVWTKQNDWGSHCYEDVMEFLDYTDLEKFIDSSYAMGCEEIQYEVLEDGSQEPEYEVVEDEEDLKAYGIYYDPDTTRDCILYALSHAETQEEKDYYWDLLDKADFAEDYE